MRTAWKILLKQTFPKSVINISCQMQMPRSDLTSSSSNKVWFIISACVALWNLWELILTLDLLLSSRIVKIFSAQKWKPLLAMPFSMSTWFKEVTEKFKFTCITGREMILVSLLQKNWDPTGDLPHFCSSAALQWNMRKMFLWKAILFSFLKIKF